MEIWKKIEGFEKYEVSTLGRIRNGNFILKPMFNRTYKNTGYYFVKLNYVHLYVHRIVAKAFLPNPENKPQVNHKDGNKANNALGNLEWNTVAENNLHAYRSGIKVSPSCEQRFWCAKLTNAEVRVIKMRLKAGERTGAIAKEYSVSPATICDIKNGRTWVKLTDDQILEETKHVA